MDTDQPLPSDGQLAVAARDGVAEAWAELELRHGRIAAAVARKLYGRHGKSRARIGLDKLRAEVLHGTGVVVDDRNRALRAFRPRSVAAVTDGSFNDPTASSSDEHQALASAFASLPEPWQAALWHHHVDLEPASGFTDVVGRTLANTDLLIERATDDLLDAFADELRVAGAPLTDGERVDRRNTIHSMLPEVLVPRVATMSVADYRTAIGAVSTLASTLAPEPSVAPPVSPAAPAVDPVEVPAPPPPVIPVAIDEVVAAPVASATRQLPQAEPVATERPTLPSAGTAPPLSADEIPPAPVTSGRKSSLIVALLFGVVAVALLGAAIALFDAVRSGDDTPADGPAVVDPDDADSTDRSDQENVFGMQFTVGESNADLGDEVEVSIKAPGPIFEGSHGTLRVLMANKGTVDIAPRLTITPPDGVAVGQVIGATCTGLSSTISAPAQCDLAIAPGDTIATEVNFDVSEPAVGRFVLDTNVVADPIDVAIEPVRELRYGAVGRGDVLMIGNSVLSCDEAAPACAGARDGTGAIFSRRDLPAAFIGSAPAFGLANSSSARLDLGEAGVSAAFLFWSGDLNVGDRIISTDDPIANVTFAPPNDQPVEILEATELRMSESDDQHYIAYADVTELVTRAGSGSYLVGNVQSVELGGSHAGWSLVVVTDDDRKPLRELVVLSPFDHVDAATAAQSIMPTENLRRAPTAMWVLTFDTDRGSTGDALAVNGVGVGDDNGDLFGSTIVGTRNPDHVDNFGTGIADYRFELNAPDALVAVDASSSDDEFHVGAIAMAIDLE